MSTELHFFPRFTFGCKLKNTKTYNKHTWVLSLATLVPAEPVYTSWKVKKQQLIYSFNQGTRSQVLTNEKLWVKHLRASNAAAWLVYSWLGTKKEILPRGYNGYSSRQTLLFTFMSMKDFLHFHHHTPGHYEQPGALGCTASSAGGGRGWERLRTERSQRKSGWCHKCVKQWVIRWFCWAPVINNLSQMQPGMTSKLTCSSFHTLSHRSAQWAENQ